MRLIRHLGSLRPGKNRGTDRGVYRLRLPSAGRLALACSSAQSFESGGGNILAPLLGKVRRYVVARVRRLKPQARTAQVLEAVQVMSTVKLVPFPFEM